MKKIFPLVGIVILAAGLVMAFSTPPPQSEDFKHGTLDWHPNSCRVLDHISIQATQDIFLVGRGFPTYGRYVGCHIDAYGIPFSFGMCKYLYVQTFKVHCTGIP